MANKRFSRGDDSRLIDNLLDFEGTDLKSFYKTIVNEFRGKKVPRRMNYLRNNIFRQSGLSLNQSLADKPIEQTTEKIEEFGKENLLNLIHVKQRTLIKAIKMELSDQEMIQIVQRYVVYYILFIALLISVFQYSIYIRAKELEKRDKQLKKYVLLLFHHKYIIYVTYICCKRKKSKKTEKTETDCKNVKFAWICFRFDGFTNR